MTVAVYLPLLLAPLLALAARRISTRGTPDLAARALAVAAVVAAAASTWSLCLLALTLLDDLPPLATLDDHPRIELPEPVPGAIALTAVLFLVWSLIRLRADLRRRLDTHRKLREVAKPHAGLVVADWDAPLAVAVPGRPGHLLVTTGMLRLLDDDERRAVFAHEHAHLAYRHHRLVAWTAAAAALNPLLTGVRETAEFLVERWADEDAATTVGDRALVAQAVARASLATSGSGPTTMLGMHGGQAVHRVRALADGAPSPQRSRFLPPILLTGGILGTTAVATIDFVDLARAWL
ncbi:M56 family metallopeptidase [Micromonospora sp. NPDC047557]|uniref:M56 family metallopeptidase n=1 Tax=Micromonospora sp. NPDC047557 TaxID=3364250 RepID=UPI003715DDB3